MSFFLLFSLVCGDFGYDGRWYRIYISRYLNKFQNTFCSGGESKVKKKKPKFVHIDDNSSISQFLNN